MRKMHCITPHRMKASFIMLLELGIVLMHFKSMTAVAGLMMRIGNGMNIGGVNPGFAYDHHQDCSAEQQQTKSNQDRDECDGQYERKGNQNHHFDGACDQGGRDQQSKGGVDAREDQYPGECSTRDDWGQPSSQESHLDKAGGSSWHDEQLEHGKDVTTKDEALPDMTEHGAMDCNLGNKGSSWEVEAIAPVSRKESDTPMLCLPDATVSSKKRPSAKAIVQTKDGTEETLKQESQPGQLKALVNSGRDGEGATSSPIKKEHSHARNPAFSAAESEGRALKHSADRLKNQPGLEIESTNLYLQAALKFLQAASIVENENTESKHAGETQAMVVYNDTAILCKYCADKYERSHDLAAAALAYTCAAMALCRRMLCKKACFASNHSELYTAVQQMPGSHITFNGPLLPPPLPSHSAEKPGPSIVPVPGARNLVGQVLAGESPSSSSASDVDNLNNQLLGPSDKSTMAQMMGRAATASPHTMPGATAAAVPSFHIIPPCLHSSFIQFLKDANDMSNLLEAWQKVANVTSKAEATCDQKGMLAVKRVGELGGFGDIETVVHLAQVAMDTIGH